MPRSGADLAREPEVDLTMAGHGSRALGVEAPKAVVAALAQESRAVGAQVALEVTALHAPMTGSDGSAGSDTFWGLAEARPRGSM